MNRKIEVSDTKLYRKLQKIEQDGRGKIHYQARKAIKETAERARDLGDTYASQAEYDGVNDVEVEIKKINPWEYDIMFTGDTLLFIEYGTGIYKNEKAKFLYKGVDYLPKNKSGDVYRQVHERLNKKIAFYRNMNEGAYLKAVKKAQSSQEWPLLYYNKNEVNEKSAKAMYLHPSKGVLDYWFYTIKAGNEFNAGGTYANGHPNSAITHGNAPNRILEKTLDDISKESIEIFAKRGFRFKR